MSTDPGQADSLLPVRYQLRATGVPFDPPNSLRSGIHHRGYLPHVKREGACYFVTFRLEDSLPASVLAGFRQERDERIRRLESCMPMDASRQQVERTYRRRVERYLDQGRGACHLGRPEIADLVAGALRHFDGERYRLQEWVVMPNHVHVLVWPLPGHLLGEITKAWKGYTARQANLLLGRSGKPFWQRESFDHWVRSEEEEGRIGGYIRRNPVGAGLCSQPEEWRWGSARRAG